jgi:hypothetical protein
MNTFDRLRAQVLAVFPEVLGEIADELSGTTLKLVEESRARLASGRFYVVCCGEFRKGKSSLLNALVGRPGLFPVDVNVTTCAVTVLEWGEEEQAVAYLGDRDRPDAAPERVTMSLDAVADYVSEQSNPRNRKNVRHVVMTARIPQLESGLALVDTPGIGSVNVEHTSATYAFLPNADAILFVCSGVEAISEHEISFLADALGKCEIIVTAVTMIDKVVDASPVVDAARIRIAETAGLAPDDLLIVPVSALRKWQAVEDDDDVELLDESGFPELEAQIWGGLAATCGAAQLRTALAALGAAVATAQAQLENQLAALLGDEAFLKVERQLQEALGKAEQLRKDGAKWRHDFSDSLKKAARPIASRLDKELSDARTELNNAFNTSRGVENAESVVADACSLMVDAVNEATASLREDFGTITKRFAAQTSLPLSADLPEADTFSSSIGLPGNLPEKVPGGFRRFRASWGGGMALGGAGGAVGAIIGSLGGPVGAVVGFGLGSMIGQAIGMVAGSRDHVRRAHRQERHDQAAVLRQTVLPQFDNNQRQAIRSLNYAVDDQISTLTQALTEQLEAQRESLAESVRLISRNKAVKEEEREQLREQLHARRQVYDQLASELNDLGRQVDNLERSR